MHTELLCVRRCFAAYERGDRKNQPQPPPQLKELGFPIRFPQVQQRKPSLKPVNTAVTNEVIIPLVNNVRASCTSNTVS